MINAENSFCLNQGFPYGREMEENMNINMEIGIILHSSSILVWNF